MYFQAQTKSYITGGNTTFVYQSITPKDYRNENELNTRHFYREGGTCVSSCG